MSLANSMHDFEACNRTPGRPKRFESQHGASDAFHCPMILFYNIVKIFALPDADAGLVGPVVPLARRGVAAALVNRHLLREPLVPNGLTKEGFSRCAIALGREQKIDRVALFVDRAI